MCPSQVCSQGAVKSVSSSHSSVHGIKYTPLGISIVFNHEIIAHKLLDHSDIDVNKATCESTALHYACLRNSVALIEAICAKVIIRAEATTKREQNQSLSLIWIVCCEGVTT